MDDGLISDVGAKTPTVLITGAGGFVGRLLVAALSERHPGWRLHAPPGPQQPGGLDVTDGAAVDAWIVEKLPDVVIHLAAVAAVTVSVNDPRLSWDVNLGGTLNIILALQQHAPKAHLLFVSSAEVYGSSFNTGKPLDELALLQPINPYAASKAAADILVRQSAAAGLPVTVMRSFNHTGPGQSDSFVVPNFANQIALIEAGLQSPAIEVGSLDDERDFLDVADVIDAYMHVLERRESLAAQGVFNVASGVPLRIGDILERLMSMSKVKIEVRPNLTRLRRASIPRVVGDASRLRSIGWVPARPINDTFERVLELQRRLVQRRY